ncbi:glutamate receptor 2.8-like [Pyrus ussuriensis x Pyrus communis]|uniref:Glutamate receptor 2.8-like n=1 Tax=Pyrus ussuriensis x Pyrus communis TaxID=2448454 RepID=A0A5N5HYX2_9ROSA|nr:glutamate receptor 2.8-like [Pyrus ussuriensis x Pyrus communis]
MFLYEHRHILMRSDPNASFRTKISEILKAFNQKGLNLHTIRNTGRAALRDLKLSGPTLNTGVQNGSDHGIGVVESSPNIVTDCSPRPSSDSIHAEPSHSVLEMQETHSTAHGNLNPDGQATQE